MNFDTIRGNIKSGAYENKLPCVTQKLYGENHIFDENQSVKWNKEEVQRRNNLYKTEKMDYNGETYRLSNLFHVNVVSAIAEYCGIDENKADYVYTLAYDNGHSNGGYDGVIDEAVELADLICKVIK